MPMAPLARTILVVLAVTGGVWGGSARGEDRPAWVGSWKLMVGDREEAIFTITADQGQPQIEVVVAPKILPRAQAHAAASAEALVLLFPGPRGDLSFRGRLPAGGNDPSAAILGACQIRIAGMPVTTTRLARLERSTATRLNSDPRPADLPEKPGLGATMDALREAHDALAEWNQGCYQALDRAVSTTAAAHLAVDATTATRSWTVDRAVAVARQAGAPDPKLEAEADRLRAELAAEAEPWPGADRLEHRPPRTNPEGTTPVLLELFTGAQCPPCVAADLAFDAVATVFPRSDVITLQYHLHIPGPDPLTGPDAIARQEYYEVRSTPSTLFNGRNLAGSGGSQAAALGKFHQYRRVVDVLTAEPRHASVAVATVHRDGDTIRVVATARLDAGPTRPRRAARLRLALVEDSVDYRGRNGLSTHHHVVRALPGGAAGRPLVNGSIRVEETVDLAAIRATQNAYLDAYPTSPGSRGPFAGTRPSLDFTHLALVAFVQDDSDHAVLDATLRPVD